MIRILVTSRNSQTIERLLQSREDIAGQVSLHTYPSVFSSGKIPCGTLVFTDFDLLQSYELDAAAHIAHEVERQRPDLKLLNHPGVALERFDLLDKLYKSGKNAVEVVRISGGPRPEHFPLFIRAEDGCAGPEGPIINSGREYDDAIAAYKRERRPLKRRIAVRYCAEHDKDGYFRKYGAFIFGDRIVSQHIMRNTDWVVKSRFRADDEEFVKEEHEYILSNPHTEWLKEIAQLSGIQFGRVDYGIFEGKLVVYEINTNPTFPRLQEGVGSPDRLARKGPLMDQIAEAFRLINTSDDASNEYIEFSLADLPNYQRIELDPPKQFGGNPPTPPPPSKETDTKDAIQERPQIRMGIFKNTIERMLRNLGLNRSKS